MIRNLNPDNPYQFKKLLTVLKYDFDLNISKKNINNARYIIETTHNIYEDLEDTAQKRQAKNLLAYMVNAL